MSSVAQHVVEEKAQAKPQAPAKEYSTLNDFSQLFKVRVTSLVVMTSWTGYFLAAAKSGVSSLSWTLLHALMGIGLTAAGAAALNEAVERSVDAKMARTKNRPLPARRMSLSTGLASGMLSAVAGSLYLTFMT